MEKRHEAALLDRLERVVTHGVAEIQKSEIKLWFQAERVARRTWRDIAAYWAELVEDPNQCKLLVGGLLESNWVFVWGQDVGTSDTSWLQDVRYLAGLTNSNGIVELIERGYADNNLDDVPADLPRMRVRRR